MIKINPSAVHRTIDGKVFIADTSRSMLYELNESATFIWHIISSKKDATIEGIVARLVKEYDVDARTARRDTIRLINYLTRKKLLLPS